MVDSHMEILFRTMVNWKYTYQPSSRQNDLRFDSPMRNSTAKFQHILLPLVSQVQPKEVPFKKAQTTLRNWRHRMTRPGVSRTS